MSNYSLPPEAHIARVALRTRSLLMAKTFYTGLLGMHLLPGNDSEQIMLLGANPHGPPLLALHDDPTARPRLYGTTGLYHVALLFHDRVALAFTLKRLLQHGWPIHGAADHGVSEALYLSDPEGNGIELYIDCAEEEWPRNGEQVEMVNKPISLERILQEIGDCSHAEIDPLTRIGHIHLNVSELDSTSWFYHDLLGLDIMQDNYPGALFFSAGGYHHHIGANIWNGHGAPPFPAKSTGLISYSIGLPTQPTLAALRARLLAQELDITEEPDGFSVRDPSKIMVRFCIAPA
jgi:catechol 2,3-dioxygenase